MTINKWLNNSLLWTHCFYFCCAISAEYLVPCLLMPALILTRSPCIYIVLDSERISRESPAKILRFNYNQKRRCSRGKEEYSQGREREGTRIVRVSTVVKVIFWKQNIIRAFYKRTRREREREREFFLVVYTRERRESSGRKSAPAGPADIHFSSAG